MPPIADMDFAVFSRVAALHYEYMPSASVPRMGSNVSPIARPSTIPQRLWVRGAQSRRQP
jgi:hypothetical protein